MHLRILTCFMVFFAAGAVAQEWQPMSGEQITATLTDQVLIYDNGEQRFYASGRTRYNAGQDSWGSWVVRGDQYCSQWPPSDRWDCYDMTRNGQGVRFVDASGNVSQGRFAE